MNLVEIDKKAIYGISVRTSNAKEMNPETAKIGETWQSFDNKVSVDYQNGERVYGVYYNYESDDTGEFDVLAGCEKESTSLDEIIIQKGKYAIFEGKSKTPDDDGRIRAVIETWGKFGNTLVMELQNTKELIEQILSIIKTRRISIFIFQSYKNT